VFNARPIIIVGVAGNAGSKKTSPPLAERLQPANLPPKHVTGNDYTTV